jgi:hypothetical protein
MTPYLDQETEKVQASAKLERLFGKSEDFCNFLAASSPWHFLQQVFRIGARLQKR